MSGLESVTRMFFAGAAENLKAFARAAHGVSGLRDKYMPRITAANIAERASDLFEEMRARMHDTIEAAGLTVENYEAMSARAAADAGFRTRVETILNGGTTAAGSPSQGQSNSSPSNLPRGSMARAQRDGTTGDR